MKLLPSLLSLGACALAVATPTDTPVPYKWGAFLPVPAGAKEAKVIAVPWYSAEGQKRLARSTFKNDFFQMAHAYQPQLTPVYAGPASAVTVLNALRLPKGIPSQKEQEILRPKALGGGVIPFPAYNQINFFDERTDRVKDRKVLGLQNVTPENENDKTAFKPGTGLDELKALLEVHGAKAEVVTASEDPAIGVKKFRAALKKILKDDTSFVLANFTGTALGAPTEGTVSPLAAYDAKTDSVLILDVTGHKNPWYWVPVSALYGAMHTQYGEPKVWRGYLVVSDGN